MSDLIDTTEMYLRTIYELREDGVVPMRARIAEQLGHAGPTVSQTVARMERDGLVTVTGDRHLELTAAGEEIATRVMRKHRLAERLLTDVIGLDLPFVHEEACRWEHVMSERVERRVLELIPGALVSPYGNPIPGLAELGVNPDARGSIGAVDTPEMAIPTAWEADVTRLTLIRIGESPQAAADLLADLTGIGLLPGTTFSIDEVDGGFAVETEGGRIVVTEDDARHLFGRSV